MYLRGIDERGRSCGLQCGWCLLVVGVVTAIFTIAFVVAPAVRGLSYHATTCTVTTVDLGLNDMFTCQCVGYCQAQSPCVRIFAKATALGGEHMTHASLSSYEQFPMCSMDNRQCATLTTAGNIQAAEAYVATNFPINVSKPCWHNGNTIVFDVDIDTTDVLDAITLPVLCVMVGLCLVCVHSASCRACGKTSGKMALYPLYFILYRGPRLLIRRACGYAPDPEVVTPSDVRRGTGRGYGSGDVGSDVSSIERLPLYDPESSIQTPDSPPGYDRIEDTEAPSSSHGSVVASDHGRGLLRFPTEPPPAYARESSHTTPVYEDDVRAQATRAESLENAADTGYMDVVTT
eukprot:m.161085 g.161085  ORF g.161085 m.161085 type:complete len:347 (+) comp12033_c0_seq1:437-1477(+)